MRKRITAIVVSFGATGLALPTLGLPQYQMTTPFSEQDFQAWVGSGPANLHGQAFLKTVGGDVKTCAGSPVFLMPGNPYDDELGAADIQGFMDVNINPKATSYFRGTICDAQGNYSFLNLPLGKWYIDTKVTWGVPHIEQPGERPGPLAALILGIKAPPSIDEQGGELRKLITLAPGENQEFLLGKDEVSRGTISPSSVVPSNIAPPAERRITSDSAPTLGINLVPTPVIMASLFKMDRNRGVWILKVDPDSAAAHAGLQQGDVILTGNGTPWDTLDEASATLNSLRAGANLTLTIWRTGAEKTVLVRF